MALITEALQSMLKERLSVTRDTECVTIDREHEDIGAISKRPLTTWICQYRLAC